MIIYNGKNSKLDFDLYIASKDVPAPTRKTITETVPYMSGVYDFSFHDGDIDEYDALKIKYSFDVIGDSKADLSRQKKLLLNWLYSRGDQRLYDVAISKNEYYEVYHATPSWSESDLQGLLTVEFLCYPFRKTELITRSIELQATEQEITLVNEGDRKIIPKIELTNKNLFDASLFKIASTADIYISRVNDPWVYITTTADYNGDGRICTGLTLQELCTEMTAGETYTLTANSNTNTKAIYLNGANIKWLFGQSLIVTQEMLESKVCFYGKSSLDGEGHGQTYVGEVQIERGKTATEYTPHYIASIAANIKHGGSSYVMSAGNYDGLFTLEKGENELTVSGTGSLTIEYNAEVL